MLLYFAVNKKELFSFQDDKSETLTVSGYLRLVSDFKSSNPFLIFWNRRGRKLQNFCDHFLNNQICRSKCKDFWVFLKIYLLCVFLWSIYHLMRFDFKLFNFCYTLVHLTFNCGKNTKCKFKKKLGTQKYKIFLFWLFWKRAWIYYNFCLLLRFA